MNFTGAALFILSSIAIFARSQYQSFTQLRANRADLEAKNTALKAELAALEAEQANLEAQVAVQRTTHAVFSQIVGNLIQEAREFEQRREVYLAEVAALREEYVRLESKNAMLIEMYDVAVNAWEK